MQGVKMLDVVSAKLFLNAVNIDNIDFWRLWKQEFFSREKKTQTF